MLRAYIRPEQRFSRAKQVETLAALGKKIAATYEELQRRRGDDFEQRDAWVASLRPGVLAVVSDFHRLATTADGLRDVRAAIHKTGAVIMEAQSGRRSDNPEDLADMTHEAMNFYRQRGLTSSEASKLGKLGADMSPTTKPKTGRMPSLEALPMWRNAEYNVPEALAAINADGRYADKYTISHAYRALGPRGVMAGRRRLPEGAKTTRGYIYFALAEKAGSVKIGYSAKPWKRMGTLSTSNHEELQCIFTMRGTTRQEKALHRKFAEFRKRGEWFEYSQPIKQFIAEKRKVRTAPKKRKKK